MNFRVRSLLSFGALLLLPTSALAQGPVPKIAVPNEDVVPGATNPDITQANINQNICKNGWSTKSIRPKTSYTNALKLSEMNSLNYKVPNRLPPVKTQSGKSTRPDIRKCVARSANAACYEEDHLISLELGGHPTKPENLWPEPWFGAWNARVKDRLENRLHKMVCDGDITLREAQRAIATDWVAAYHQYIGEP